MKVTGFESIISLQTIQSILKLSHHSSLGNECLVTGWDQDKDDSPILRISFPKLKANSQLSVSITVEVCTKSLI